MTSSTKAHKEIVYCSQRRAESLSKVCLPIKGFFFSKDLLLLLKKKFFSKKTFFLDFSPKKLF